MNIPNLPKLVFGNTFNNQNTQQSQQFGLPLTFAKSKPDAVILRSVGKITGSTQNDDENEGNDGK